MRTLRAVLAGMVVAVMVGVSPLSVVAQTDGDDPADATSDPPGEVTVVSDLVYATGRSPDEATELKLVVFSAGHEDAPMVIDVGGAVDPQTLAERGASVFLPRYRSEQIGMVFTVADPTATRTMVEALACAVRFARGSEYGSETAPLVLTGFSAGGAPASHVALAGESFDRVWDEYEESRGGPPAQYDCTFGEASSRVDGFVGIAGGYDLFVGYEGPYGRDFLQEHEPDLWETLWGTVGLHPELRVRLIHGTADNTIPFENSVAFEAVLAEAGYDVELVEFAGGHGTPLDLAVETIMELVE